MYDSSAWVGGSAACSSAGVHSNGAELPRAERDLRPVTSELMKALNRSPIHFVGAGGGDGTRARL